MKENEMREYFFLEGKEQNGPFSIEQLTQKELTKETLIWTEGMEDWQKIKDIAELVLVLKPKSVPPPLPTEKEEQKYKTEVFVHLKAIKRNNFNLTLEAIKPSKRALSWLIAWCGFHLFALLMSYSQIEFFNDGGKPESKEFWPFVKFQSCRDIIAWDNSNIPVGWNTGMGRTVGEDCHFNGLFINYDWTEFAFYIGAAIVVFILLSISNKQERSKIKT